MPEKLKYKLIFTAENGEKPEPNCPYFPNKRIGSIACDCCKYQILNDVGINKRGREVVCNYKDSTKENKMKEQYLVWNPRTGYTRFLHENKNSAEKEAERLAKDNPNDTFYVLQTIARCKATNVVWETIEEDDIPF